MSDDPVPNRGASCADDTSPPPIGSGPHVSRFSRPSAARVAALTPSRPALVTAAVLALVLTLLTPLGQMRAVATPRVQSATIDGLQAAGSISSLGVEAMREAAGARSAPAEAPLAFSMVGFEVPAGTTALRFRTSPDGTSWSSWQSAHGLDGHEGADPGTDEARADDRVQTKPAWVGEARHVQVEVAGAEPADVDVDVIDSAGLDGGPVDVRMVPEDGGAAQAADMPAIVTRQEWGAAPYKGDPDHADRVHMLVMHHTVTGNGYSEPEAPSVVRGIQRYHQDSRGWDDIGYNILVDRYGNVYEGRAGGLERGVIGAHAAGWNTGSSGIAILGDFRSSNPPNDTLWALIRTMAWKAGVHGIDPEGTTTEVGSGREKPTIVGHRDIGSTSCPGDEAHNELGWMRPQISERVGQFPDVPSGSVHRDSILRMFHDGLVKGYDDGTYKPKREVTRAQAASLLVRGLGIEEIEGQRFPDVPADSEHAGAINAMAERDAMEAYPDGDFRPHIPIPRDQLATAIAEAAGVEDSSGTHFQDVSRLSDHYGPIYGLYDAGLTEGCTDTRYCPEDPLRRDQVATFLDRIFIELEQYSTAPEDEASPSPSVSPSPSETETVSTSHDPSGTTS